MDRATRNTMPLGPQAERSSPAGQAEAVVVPLEEHRVLKALEQRESELYWVTHESRYPSSLGDNIPDGNVYDSMEALVADLGAGE